MESLGDSGGPLIQYDTSNEPVLVGVISFGYKCAQPRFPGVYVRLHNHITWLSTNGVEFREGGEVETIYRPDLTGAKEPSKGSAPSKDDETDQLQSSISTDPETVEQPVLDNSSSPDPEQNSARPSEQTSDTDVDQKSFLSTAQIIGITIGVVLFLVIIGLIIFFFRRCMNG